MNTPHPQGAPFPPEDERAYALRLAYSYEECARAQLDECERAHAAKKIDEARYETLCGFYENHVIRAQKHLEAVRTGEQRRLKQIQASIAALEAQRRELTDKVRQGRLSPERANDQSRSFQGETEGLARQAARTQAILRADSSQALGGFIQLGLDDYAARLGDEPTIGAPRKQRSYIGLIVGAGVALVVVGLAVGVVGLLPGVAGVDATITQSGTSADITVSNGGAETIQIFVPWPDGTGRSVPDDVDRGTAFGLRLHVREKGSEAFRLLPVSEGFWRYEGSTLLGYGPIVIHPGLNATVTLDTAQLAQTGIDATAMRVAVTAAGGSIVREREIEFGEIIRSP